MSNCFIISITRVTNYCWDKGSFTYLLFLWWMILTIVFVGLFRGLLSARSGGWRTLELPQWTAKGQAVSAVQRRWAGLLTRRWTNVHRSTRRAAMFARGQRWCGFRAAHGVIADSAVGAEQLLFGVQRGPAVAGQLRQLQSWQGARKCSGDQQVMLLFNSTSTYTMHTYSSMALEADHGEGHGKGPSKNDVSIRY